MSDGRVTWRLTVEAATVGDLGNFSCTVTNDAGSTSMTIEVVEGVPGAMVALQVSLGAAGLLSCLLVLLGAAWFCRSLSRSAARAQEVPGDEIEEDWTSESSSSLALRRRRSHSPEPVEGRVLAVGPVLHTIRPDFAAFYGNPHLSTYRPAADNSGSEEEEDSQLNFSGLYGPKTEPVAQRMVYFSETTPQTLQQGWAGARGAAGSEAADSLYSEPLLGYRELALSALDFECDVEDDISVLAD